MNMTRRPRLRYPNTRLLTIVLTISITVMFGLAGQSRSDITDSIVDLLAICDQCGSTQLPNPNSTLN